MPSKLRKQHYLLRRYEDLARQGALAKYVRREQVKGSKPASVIQKSLTKKEKNVKSAIVSRFKGRIYENILEDQLYVLEKGNYQKAEVRDVLFANITELKERIRILEQNIPQALRPCDHGCDESCLTTSHVSSWEQGMDVLFTGEDSGVPLKPSCLFEDTTPATEEENSDTGKMFQSPVSVERGDSSYDVLQELPSIASLRVWP